MRTNKISFSKAIIRKSGNLVSRTTSSKKAGAVHELPLLVNSRVGFYALIVIVVCFAQSVFIPSFTTGAYAAPIIRNEVEDPNIISIGAKPNVLTILDLSNSMGVNFGGKGVGNWDSTVSGTPLQVSTIIDCENAFCTGGVDGCEVDNGLLGGLGQLIGLLLNPLCVGIPPLIPPLLPPLVCNLVNGLLTDHLVERVLVSHCIENAANTSVCGSKNCKNGICEDADEFNNQLACVLPLVGGLVNGLEPLLESICTGPRIGPAGLGACVTPKERALVAAVLEIAGGLSLDLDPPLTLGVGLGQCFQALNADLTAPAGLLGILTSFTALNYQNFKTCMQTTRPIKFTETIIEAVLETLAGAPPANLPSAACDGGTPNCRGVPTFGSSRVDLALNSIFNFMDADNSLAGKTCSDPQSFFDNVNTQISCSDFMATPFRDVSDQVRGTGNLPTTPTQQPLNAELSDNDASLLNLRLRAMTYSGERNWSGCNSNANFVLSGDFEDATGAELREVWNFLRANNQSGGGTPLALALGLDDSNSSGDITNDAIRAFRDDITNDNAVSCRPQFTVLITDGEDNCSGDCIATPASCTGEPQQLSGITNLELLTSQLLGGIISLPINLDPLVCALLPTLCAPTLSPTTNANRRSSVQSVSNLRTFYARNPAGSSRKEVLTFVVGLGVRERKAIRTLNAMALTGGTHTAGVIMHEDPDGKDVGVVDIDSVLPAGALSQVFKDLGTAKDIDTNPAGAQLQGCKTPSEIGACSFQSNNVFDDNFFDGVGGPFDSTVEGQSFAFFANNPEELAVALQNILRSIETFSTSGVSPAAPQSPSSIALRDRVFLSIFTPVAGERLWQGRLALYGLVDDPSNIGSKVIIRKPDGGADLTDPSTVEALSIFNPDDNSLNDNAEIFHWEAGRELAGRDLAAAPRNLFTVDVTDDDTIDTVRDGSNVVSVRYTGGRIDFDNGLAPEAFGISDADVTNPIPDFCTSGGVRDCSSTCGSVSSTACRSCVKECIRDRIVSFMSGNTEIQPTGDPLGEICSESDADAGVCSVRLGDMFHSAPVAVGSPSPLFFDEGFQNYALQFRDRSAVVYVGANDGFLHAFHAGDFVDTFNPSSDKTNPFTGEEESFPFFNRGTGEELFAFAAPSFLPDSTSVNGAEPPSGATPPDFRFGDLKTFVLESETERSFFDGSPLIADVWIDGYANGITADEELCEDESGTGVGTPDGEIDLCGREWHSILLTGFRNGGGAYTALDVTNIDKSQGGMKKFSSGPDYPSHLWTTFDTNFGNAWSEPSIGRVRMNTTDKKGVDRWVMFVGGGLHPTDIDPANGLSQGFGNGFYIIDIPTGKIIFKFSPDNAADADDPQSRMVCDMASKAGVFDFNADGYSDAAYIGDTCGRLWRFDVSMPVEANGSVGETGVDGNAVITAPDWRGDIAFCANTSAQCDTAGNPARVPAVDRQPIFFPPTVVIDDLGRRHVIFTTGNRREPSNINEFGRLYNFIDSFIPAFLAGGAAVSASTRTESDLTSEGQVLEITGQGIAGQFTVNPPSAGAGDFSSQQGEFVVRFPGSRTTAAGSQGGEKGIGSPIVINRTLVFTTFAPDTTNPCEIGTGRIFALDYLSGEPALARIPGARDRIQGGETEQREAAGLVVGQGLPAPGQVTFGAGGSAVLTVTFTGGPTVGGSQSIAWELPAFPAKTQTLFWEEIL